MTTNAPAADQGCPWFDCRAPAAEISAGYCNVCGRAPGNHPDVYKRAEEDEWRAWQDGCPAPAAATQTDPARAANPRTGGRTVVRRLLRAVERRSNRLGAILRVDREFRAHPYRVHGRTGEVRQLRWIVPGVGAWCEHHAPAGTRRMLISWMRLIRDHHPFDSRYDHLPGRGRPSIRVLTRQQMDEAIPF